MAKYKERREKEYSNVIQSMKQYMGTKNDEIEEKIRYQAEFIKKEIAAIDSEMDFLTNSTEFNRKRVNFKIPSIY